MNHQLYCVYDKYVLYTYNDIYKNNPTIPSFIHTQVTSFNIFKFLSDSVYLHFSTEANVDTVLIKAHRKGHLEISEMKMDLPSTTVTSGTPMQFS